MRRTHFFLIAFLTLILHVSGLPFIKTAKVRGRRYRQKLITELNRQHQVAHPGAAPLDFSKYHADHLLELQQVTGWLNEHHRGALPATCLPALKAVLNDPLNLAMVLADTNLSKGRSVRQIVAGKDVTNFSHDVNQHIGEHESNIETVARRADIALRDHCGLGSTIGAPMLNQARKMFRIARAH